MLYWIAGVIGVSFLGFSFWKIWRSRPKPVHRDPETGVVYFDHKEPPLRSWFVGDWWHRGVHQGRYRKDG